MSNLPQPLALLIHGGSAAHGAELASEIGLPLVQKWDESYPFHLTLTETRLELRQTIDPPSRPVWCDFGGEGSGGKRGRRLTGADALIRAMGPRPGCTTLIDATAGLGRDAFALAKHGYNVLAFERCGALWALVRDGLTRARRIPALEEIINERLAIRYGDARKLLTLDGTLQPDVVYMDPMFPIDSHATAAVKKEMRLLRGLVGDDTDAAELLDVAKGVARKRVVVKRMRHAPPIHPSPDVTISGRTVRYDVYLRRKQ